MRIVCISDTHDYALDHMGIPDGDVLIHAGDATGMGTVKSIAKFNMDLGKLPHKHKLFVPGNHDWLFERDWSLAESMITNAEVLRNRSVIIDGIKFYGSPAVPQFGHWAFMYNPQDIEVIWRAIPSDTDVLITHGPPKYILDTTDRGTAAGCKHLLSRLENLNVKLHVFGHIHEGYGEYKGITIPTHFVNASICDEDYNAINKPIVFDYV